VWQNPLIFLARWHWKPGAKNLNWGCKMQWCDEERDYKLSVNLDSGKICNWIMFWGDSSKFHVRKVVNCNTSYLLRVLLHFHVSKMQINSLSSISTWANSIDTFTEVSLKKYNGWNSVSKSNCLWTGQFKCNSR